MILFYQFLLGFIISLIVSLAAVLTKTLSFSGGIAALILGTTIIGTGPWYSVLLAGALFFSSGMISLSKKRLTRSSQLTETRNHKQVLANLLPGVCSLLFFFQTQNELFLIGYAASISSAAADTWASEIGTLSKKVPRSILTFRTMPTGISGGISILGTFASICGAGFLSGLFYLLHALSLFHLTTARYFWLPFLLGILGSLIDSLLGAVFQVIYRCQICGELTEKRSHHQTETKKVQGLCWFTNNWTNFFATSLVTLFSWIIGSFYF
ncbi:TIGR00297 family protein [Enterococcus faecalis 13-SD-W-01]|nr:TIGR00297 family protein [Enterococcus faecalis 13-SD-W-01]